MLTWKWLLILDGVTSFIIGSGGAFQLVSGEIGKGESMSKYTIIGIIVVGLVLASNTIRTTLKMPPPTREMVAAAAAAVAPLAARDAAREAAPIAAREAAPAAIAEALSTGAVVGPTGGVK